MSQAVNVCILITDWLCAAKNWLAETLMSLNADWYSALGTCVTAIIAALALTTWRKQIRLQDRYQKVDALLSSFILCIRAGHDWQWSGDVGEHRACPAVGEVWEKWRDALMAYRKDWMLTQHLFGQNEGKTLWFNPDQLQGKVIGAGQHLRDPVNNLFETEMQKILYDGVRDIIKIREGK